MAHPHHRLPFRLQRMLALSLLVASGAAALLAGCGARSGIELLGAAPASGGAAAPTADPPDPALPARAGSAGMGGSAGSDELDAGVPDAPDASVTPTMPEPPVKLVCESVTLDIDDLRPEVTLLVDQSRSMNMGYPVNGSPDTRWSLVGKALFDPTNGVVKTFEGSVRFGVAFFTSHPNLGQCPILHEVPASTGNYQALSTLYGQLAPDGSTPTGAALQQLVTELQAAPSPSQQSIVLVTDGNPNTCAVPMAGQGNNMGGAGQAEAIAATDRAFAAGFDVYVLGISKDIAGQNLQQLANAGKGQPIDDIYGVDPDAAEPYEASDNVTGLTAQFSDILAQIPFCEVKLSRDVAEAEASTGKVLLDGQPLPYSATNGYTLKDSRHLDVVGSACDAIKAGAKQLSVRISCDDDAGL